MRSAVLIFLAVQFIKASVSFANEEDHGITLYKNQNKTFVQSVDLYGFIKSGVLVSSGGLDSFGRPNAVAPTSAGNPILNLNPDQARSSFQSQQSRFGLAVRGEENVSGILEFDFVDFSKSTPTVASGIRLRRAYVNFESGHWEFRVGQDWDLFSPLGPESYNFVGHYFGTGDLGFMRQQAQILNKVGNWEHAVALGFPSNNNQMEMTHAELSLAPTIAVRETYKMEHGGQVGVSAILGHLKNFDTKKKFNPFGLNAFLKKSLGQLEVSSEVYYGHNLENLSMLALGFSPTLDVVKELGGFVTLRYQKRNHGIFGGVGHSQILNAENVDPSYSMTSGGATLNLASGASTGFGLLENSTARIGYDYRWTKKLKLFTEVAYLKSKHKLDAGDATVNPNRNVLYVEFGAYLKF